MLLSGAGYGAYFVMTKLLNQTNCYLRYAGVNPTTYVEYELQVCGTEYCEVIFDPNDW